MINSVFKDQTGRKVTVQIPLRRIVSVVPSQTELLFDLGLDKEIAGITKFCVHPAGKVSSVSKVGGTKNLNIPKIRELAPDLIIANKEENDKEQIEQLMQEFPVWISDINDLAGATEMIREIGKVVCREQQAVKLAREINLNFDTLVPGSNPVRVAYFIWKNPYMVAATDTFINAMLGAAGWENAFQLERYPEVTVKDITAADPDVVFLSSEPYPFKEKHLEEFKRLCPDAAVVIVDGELFSWYGSRLMHTAAYLKEMQLHVNQRATD